MDVLFRKSANIQPKREKKMALLKKNDLRRRYISFKKHTFFVLQPFVVSVLIVLIWYQFYRYDLHFSHDDEVVLTGAIVTTLGVTYSITASLVFSSIWKKYQTVVICVLKKDRDTFLYYRDERVPIIIHVLILTFSFLLIIITGGMEYKHLASGIAAVFSISFALCLYFIVIVELQNPAKALWFAERIPKKWLEVDIDRHFKLEKGE